jgi:hypothetical protein
MHRPLSVFPEESANANQASSGCVIQRGVVAVDALL